MTSAATRSLVIERHMPFPPEKIWRALTDGTLIRQWLMESDFQPAVGHQFNLRAKPVGGWNGIIDSKVTIVEPNKKLAYTWSSMGLNSVVTWTLSPAKDGTVLRMEQTGFNSDQDAAYKGANYGWQKFIAALEGVVNGLQ
jgi:uncharacterized protein YndB with AHSA1/START domain